MSGHLKNILTLLAAALVTLVLLASMTRVTRTLAPRLRARLAQRAAAAPLLREAARLAITYESALAAPGAAVGKPALWCLRDAGGGRTLYNGDESRPVYISNPASLPAPAGSIHRGCADALVEIASVTYSSFGVVSGARLEARFIGVP